MHLRPSFSSSLPLTSVPTLISLSCVQLNLRSNSLLPEGAKALAPALAASASLTWLKVEYNGLGDEGRAIISSAVQGKVDFHLSLRGEYE